MMAVGAEWEWGPTTQLTSKYYEKPFCCGCSGGGKGAAGREEGENCLNSSSSWRACGGGGSLLPSVRWHLLLRAETASANNRVGVVGFADPKPCQKKFLASNVDKCHFLSYKSLAPIAKWKVFARQQEME